LCLLVLPYYVVNKVEYIYIKGISGVCNLRLLTELLCRPP